MPRPTAKALKAQTEETVSLVAEIYRSSNGGKKPLTTTQQTTVNTALDTLKDNRTAAASLRVALHPSNNYGVNFLKQLLDLGEVLNRVEFTGRLGAYGTQATPDYVIK